MLQDRALGHTFTFARDDRFSYAVTPSFQNSLGGKAQAQVYARKC
jgi:hypothetical protein